MSEYLKFESLKSHDYDTWSVKMYSALVKKNVHRAVDGGVEFEAMKGATKALMNMKALKLMRSKIRSSALRKLILDDTSAKVAWEKLASSCKARREDRARARMLRELKMRKLARQMRYAHETARIEALKQRLFAVKQAVRKARPQVDDMARANVPRSRGRRSTSKSVKTYAGNQGALKPIHHPHAHQRTKHIDNIAYRFIQYRVERGEMSIETAKMVAGCINEAFLLVKIKETVQNMCRKSLKN